MALDARRHEVPLPGNTPRRAAFDDLSLSIGDIVYVANTTDRAQRIAALTAAGFGPSATRPIYVHRGDAPAGKELEYSTNGTTWASVSAPIAVGRLERTVGLNVPNAAWTAVGWSTSDVTGLGWDSPNLVVSTAGWYRIDAAVRFAAASAGRRGVGVSLNGGEPVSTDQTIAGPGVNAPVTYSTPSVLRMLPANTRIGVQVYQDSGATIVAQVASLTAVLDR